MPKPDLTYRTDGMLLTLFPETDAGTDAWDVIMDAYGGGTIPHAHLPSIRLQLKEAGMTIHKARRRNPATAAEIGVLLAELGD